MSNSKSQLMKSIKSELHLLFPNNADAKIKTQTLNLR